MQGWTFQRSAGELYIADPVEGQVYGYGQKDYRGSGSFTSYVQYKNGEFVDVEKCDLVRVLNEKEDSLDDEM